MAEVMEAEGKRMTQLRKALRKALSRSFEACSPEQVEAFFPEDMREGYGGVIQQYTAQILGNVMANIENEFDVIVKEQNLVAKLNKLEQLVAEQPVLADGVSVPRFASGSIDEILRHRVVTRKEKEKERLEDTLAKLEEENAALRAQLVPKRQEVSALEAQVEDQTRFVAQAVSACEAYNKDVAAQHK